MSILFYPVISRLPSSDFSAINDNNRCNLRTLYFQQHLQRGAGRKNSLKGKSSMQKKSSGRGIQGISDIFLSSQEGKKTEDEFSSVKLRDETCESCTNIIREADNAPKCKIFTVENKKYGVRYMDTISMTSGRYCRYFKSISQENNLSRSSGKETSTDHTETQCEIEENIIVRRNIAYPNTSNAQQDMLKSLSKHLEKNYRLERIELRKVDRICQPGMEKCKEERITIFIRGIVK